jgi:hypothetical protein
MPEGTKAAETTPAAPPDDFNEYIAWRQRQESDEPEPAATPAESPEAAKPAAKTAAEPGSAEITELDEEPEEETEQPKKKGGFQKRIDKLVREKNTLEARLTELERSLADKAGKPSGEDAKPPEPKPGEKAKPTPDGYQTYEEYVEDLTDWKVEQRETARQAEDERRAAEEAETELAKGFKTRIADAEKKYGDFKEVAAAEDLMLSPAMQQVIRESPAGLDVAYYLGQHREEADAIFEMTPLDAIRALGRIEGKIEAAEQAKTKAPETKPAAPAAKPSNAPKPIAPVSGTKAGGQPSINDETLASDYNAWEKVRKAQLTRR